MGLKGTYIGGLFPQYIKKQKYILLYTYTTTPSHNQPNSISPTARSRPAWRHHATLYTVFTWCSNFSQISSTLASAQWREYLTIGLRLDDIGYFSCFYRYGQMKRQVLQTCLHSSPIICFLWFVDCVLATWPTVFSNLFIATCLSVCFDVIHLCNIHLNSATNCILYHLFV